MSSDNTLYLNDAAQIDMLPNGSRIISIYTDKTQLTGIADQLIQEMQYLYSL